MKFGAGVRKTAMKGKGGKVSAKMPKTVKMPRVNLPKPKAPKFGKHTYANPLRGKI